MLNPQDSVINYNKAAPPVQPAFGKIGKWVRTPSLDWNTTAYKCYIYDSCDFRLHFPQTYKPGDGKKYPILIFYNGNGEEGPITDDESQLKNGGLMFHEAEVNGTFDGYILFMQDQNGFGLAQLTSLRNLIDTLTQEYGGDPYRVVANGLSGGGQAIFNQLSLTPSYFAGAIIMSAALLNYATPQYINPLKYTPIWDLDGGLDDDPTPGQAQYVDSAYLSLGGNYTYKNYPTLGHGTWDSTWLEPNFWPFVNNTYQSNPWTLYGKTVFCPGQAFKVTIGVVPGLSGYQWRLNGTVIPNATADSLVVTQAGTYDARVLRGATWSDWSHVPVQILAQVPAPVADIVQPSCTVSTGTINVAGPKSVGLTYSIDNVHYQTDTAFRSVAAGTYTLTVKNGTTCMSAPTTVIVHPQPVTPAQPTVTITQPSCTTPKAIIALTSNDTGLVYSINNGQYYVTYDKFTGLVPGTYWPKVKNGAGCSSSFMVSVVNPGPPVPATPAVTVTQPTCTVGTGSITISSPVDTFTYSINNTNYQSGGSFTSVAVGNYNVTAKNSEGCASLPSVAAVLAPPSAPVAPVLTVIQPTCTVATGTISVSGAVDSLSYRLNNGAWQSSGVFSGMAAGSYQLSAENSAGCVSSPSTANVFTQPSAPATPGLTVTQPTCTVATGTISVSTPIDSIRYNINNGSYEPVGSFPGLVPGSYTVTAENSAGCVSAPFTSVILMQPVAPPAPQLTVVQPTCIVGTGTISISLPVDTFTYSINNANYQSSGTFTGVAVGSYKVTAENSEGCISSPSVAAVLAPPSAPAAPVLTVTQPTCAVATGTISVSAAVDSLSYSLNNGAWQPAGVFNGMAAGSYQVMAENGAGCVSSPATATILMQPSTPATPGLTVTQPTCTVATGTISVSTPVDSLNYNINNGTYQPVGSFPGLVPGSYTVTAENSAGCVSAPFTSVIVMQPVTPAAPELTVTQPTCIVGTGTISVSSPVDTLSYSINNGSYQPVGSYAGLAPGSYAVTAETSAGCVSSPATAALMMPPNSPPAPAFTIIQPTCAVATGTITISSPVDSFSYSINNGDYVSSGKFVGLSTGSYPVTAENSAGCISSPSEAVILPPPGLPPAPQLTIIQPTCSVTTGSLAVVSAPGEGLMYSINDTSYQVGSSFTGLLPGNYPVTIRDSAGCVSSPAAAVISPLPASCNLVISVYPNPYAGEVNFSIVSPETGKGLLMFYNLLGEQMSTVYEADFTAGIPVSIHLPMNFAHKQAVVYQFTVGKMKMQGTLLPQKF